MKKWFTLINLLILLSGCTAKHLEIFPELSDPTLINTKLTVVQMHEDIDAFIMGAKNRHPALGSYADFTELERVIPEIKAAITSPMVRTEFYRHIGRLTHLFNDGHSLLIWPYQEYKALTESGEKPFPFEVVITKTPKILLKHTYQVDDQLVPAGAEVASINGMDATQLLTHLQQYASGETHYLRTQFVAGRFGLMLWSALGYLNEFELTVVHDQKTTTHHIHKEQNWQKDDKNDVLKAVENKDYYYQKLNANAGFLYLGHFDIDPDDFEDFVDGSFKQIRTDNISNLIIDIRDNPGGNTDTVAYLSRYLADKPFRLVSAMKEKLNKANRGWFNYKGEVGDILMEEWNDYEQPMKPGKRFSGDVFLLTGAVSYSSAIVFATTLKDNGFATLVGETTGGFANQTAQGNLFNLPNSELRAYIATRLLVRPSGDTSRTGVVPHHEVIPTEEDIVQQNDVALSKVMELIANPNIKDEHEQ